MAENRKRCVRLAKASLATNVAVFARSSLAIPLIGCDVMKFWERVQAK